MPMVRRRVIHLAGYDPLTPGQLHARFARELKRFEACWGVSAGASGFRADAETGSWVVESQGPGWRVTTEHIVIRWDDVIAQSRGHGLTGRIAGGLAAGLDFTLNGALMGYLRHGPRYALFFLYPFAALALALASGWLAMNLLDRLGAPSLAAAAAGGLLAGAGLIAAWTKGQVATLFDDWSFARRIVRHEHPVISARIALGARLAREAPADMQVLIVGHSLGAAFAAELAAEAAAPSTGADAGTPRPVSLVTVGSSVLKIGLHRKAQRLRAAVARIAAADSVTWADYQTVNDPMNFFGSEPVSAMGLAGKPAIVRRVRMGHMLDPAYYRRIRTNFFRIHNQFVSGNDRRAPYDYLMMVAGPFALPALAAERTGAVGWLDAEGGLTEAGRAALDAGTAGD
jgi:hypothetical protein